MSVKIRIAVLVVLLLSVMGVTVVSASSTLPAPDQGTIGTCYPCLSQYYGWYCVTPGTVFNPNSDVGDLNYFSPGCVWSHYANCFLNVCICEYYGTADHCKYGFEN